MKKTVFVLLAVIMCVAGSAKAAPASMEAPTNMELTIPVNLIIHQIVNLKDGSTINVYYEKSGDVCKLYSNVDVTMYTEKDLNKIKSTTFEVADHVEGKCYMTKNTSDVFALVKSIFKKIM